jgi:hypothetical protein
VKIRESGALLRMTTTTRGAVGVRCMDTSQTSAKAEQETVHHSTNRLWECYIALQVGSNPVTLLY